MVKFLENFDNPWNSLKDGTANTAPLGVDLPENLIKGDVAPIRFYAQTNQYTDTNEGTGNSLSISIINDGKAILRDVTGADDTGEYFDKNKAILNVDDTVEKVKGIIRDTETGEIVNQFSKTLKTQGYKEKVQEAKDTVQESQESNKNMVNKLMNKKVILAGALVGGILLLGET